MRSGGWALQGVRSILLAWVIGPFTDAFCSGQEDKRLPVPDVAAQKNAEKLVRDTFKDEYARRGTGAREALANLLLDQSRQIKDDPPTLYVLLRDAKDFAIEAGKSTLALQAIEELSRQFRVDAARLKYGAYSQAFKDATSAAEFADWARRFVRLAEEAVRDGDYETAGKALDTAANLAKEGKEIPLIGKVQARRKELDDLKARSNLVKKARETLASNPEDPSANQTLGQYACFVQGDWTGGLPRLAKGTDPILKGLAAKEQSTPSAPADRMALGDGWWDLSEKEAGVVRDRQRDRAHYWYRQILDGLTGLAKVKVEKRISQVEAELRGRGE